MRYLCLAALLVVSVSRDLTHAAPTAGQDVAAAPIDPVGGSNEAEHHHTAALLPADNLTILSPRADDVVTHLEIYPSPPQIEHVTEAFEVWSGFRFYLSVTSNQSIAAINAWIYDDADVRARRPHVLTWSPGDAGVPLSHPGKAMVWFETIIEGAAIFDISYDRVGATGSATVWEESDDRITGLAKGP